MSQKIFQVDAFTNKAFGGNPAAVCILNESRDEQWMKNIAREMNLSETAFLEKQNDGYNLRWFTPTVEVALCGHATLASAHILWEENILKENEQARFHTLSGLLTAEKKDDWMELDFPAKEHFPVDSFSELEKALGISATYIGKNDIDYFFEVASEEIVRSMKPNFSFLESLPVRDVIVTSRSSTKEFDFVSRFFAPSIGINEDPVTGAAHCYLAPYWKKKLGKDEMIGYQASTRGGIVKVRVEGNRVKLGGQAITVLRCELL